MKILDWISIMGGGTILKVGATSAREKIMENFCGFN